MPESMGIKHVRMDDRLIHGQVATMWTNALKVDRIMVIDDAAASSDITKMTLKLSVPNGIALSVLSVAKAAERIKGGAYHNQRVFVIVIITTTLYRLVQEGVPISEVNLGNQAHQEGYVKLAPTISFSKDDIKCLAEINARGIKLIYQLIPQHARQDLGSTLKQENMG